MGWFSFEEPGEKLEALIKKASRNPSAVPDFYRAFLEGELYVIGKALGPAQISGDGDKFVEGGEIQFNLFDIEGQKQICAYSSLKILTQSIQEQTTYVRMKTRDFLEMLEPESLFILNAGAPVGKKFTWQEIEDLRSGKIFEVLEFNLRQGEKLILGQPAQPPQKTLEALQAYFSSHLDIECAYLGQVFYTERKEPPHCVIGLRLKGSSRSFQEVVKDLSLRVRSLHEAPIIDFVNVTEVGTISEYLLKETTPIFKAA
ncbi:MAG: enhanced serine sensitivity protein SseB C-terminal domain-containing protein [Candidatus Omnitrophica bacterium]|nr:enhanced serine sensitivity protein SseB C-terminal domain-containing protein [Candidatus Omnitrophota bacterium]